MLAFVTSIRARALAHDWAYHVRLLDRTVASLLAQTDPNIRVVVVGHDRPEMASADPRIHFIGVDIPLPKRDFDDMTTDKGLKIAIGADWAIAQGCQFVMFADADDLVSRRLAAFALQRPEANGWYIKEGYSHQYGQPWVTRSRNHDQTCGTCAIVRADRLEFVNDPGFRGGRVTSFSFGRGHADFRDVMANAGHPLAPLPFPGSIYIKHPDSIVTTRLPSTTAPTPRERLQAGRRAWHTLLDSRPVTPALAHEFTIRRSKG